MNGLPVPPMGDPPRGGKPRDPDSSSRPDQRLGRSRRITKSQSFEETYSQQQKWVGRFMILWLRSGSDACLRLGVVASRKVGGSVQRTRARRLLREVFRRQRSGLDGAVDIVLVARASLLKASFPSIQEDFLALASKAGLCSAA